MNSVQPKLLNLGLGLIPKPKLADTVTDTETFILNGESSYREHEVFFSIIKGPLKPNFLPNIRYS